MSIVVLIWERGELVGLLLLTSLYQRIIKQSMRCANNAASEAAARMRPAEEQADQYSTEGDNAPAATNKHLLTPIVAGARGQPRADSSPAASAAGGSPVAHGPEIEVLYSGESDSPSESKPSAKPDRTVA